MNIVHIFFYLALRQIMLFSITSSKTAIQTNICTCESAAKAYFAQDDVIVIILREIPVTTGIFLIMTVRWRVRHDRCCIDSLSSHRLQ